MATIDEFIEQWHNSCSYIEAHTSGSTGEPKLIRLPKSDMLQSAKATNRFFGITEKSVLALPLSVDYIAGKMMVVRAIEANCKVVQLSVSNKIELSDKQHYDLLSVVPSQLDSLIAQSRIGVNTVRNLLVGGASPSVIQCEALVAAGYNAYISYGMTETCSHVALARVDDVDRVYKAMPDISFRCDDRGCLEIIAPKFTFGRLQTNDIVELVSSTEFCWLGRYDNVINSGGIKLFPEKLELEFSSVLKDIPFCVLGVADSKWGQAVALLAECSADEMLRIKSELSMIAESKSRPKYYMSVARIPRTQNGKIVRKLPTDYILL